MASFLSSPDEAVFHSAGLTEAPAERVLALRAWLVEQEADAVLITHAGLYGDIPRPLCYEYLRWVTGFSGSLGSAIITRESAALFVDGRYTLQAQAEINTHIFSCEPFDSMGGWLKKVCSEGALVLDPALHSAHEVRGLRERVGCLIYANPCEVLWTDRPAFPQGPLVSHPLAYAGVAARDKCKEVAEVLAKAGGDTLVVSYPDSLMWLLNVRGNDTPLTPLALLSALVHKDGRVELFVEENRVDSQAREDLGSFTTFCPPSLFQKALKGLSAQKACVLLDPKRVPYQVTLHLKGASVIEVEDPLLRAKAKKNTVEQEGFRRVHRRDGAYVSQVLCWVHENASTLTEMDVVRKILDVRAQDDHFRGLSFETIAATGPHAAMCHYHPTVALDAPLKDVLLLDSGGQFLDGTTDITRTVAIGTPKDSLRHHYTLVLKGHIALATLHFPAGTSGARLDSLARQPLWREGFDYNHGTGHGVGQYLCVHEGPYSLSSKAPLPLECGTVLSNEPGYYDEEKGYGIRLENLVLVVESPFDGFYTFETLSLAPFDPALIVVEELTLEEVKWVDAYHARVRKDVSPLLGDREQEWLHQVTEPLSLG